MNYQIDTYAGTNTSDQRAQVRGKSGTTTTPRLMGWWLARAAVTSSLVCSLFPVHAVENNDYVERDPINLSQWTNSINVDPATGQLFANVNHTVAVYPPGGGASLLSLNTEGNTSPYGTVAFGGNYYVGYRYWCGGVQQFDSAGTNQGRQFTLNAENCPNGNGDLAPGMSSDGISNMLVDSTGRLVIQAINQPNNGGPGVIVTDMTGTVQWSAPNGSLAGIDNNDNVYINSSSLIKVYDRDGEPLPDINLGISGRTVRDGRGNFYVYNDGQIKKLSPQSSDYIQVAAIPIASVGSFAVDPSGRYVYALTNDLWPPVISVFEQSFSPPPAPVLSAVSVGTNSPSIRATWPALAHLIESYSLEISLDQNTWTAITVPSSLTSRSISVADFPGLTAGTFYLRINATDEDGTSPYSNVVEVIISSPSTPPASTTPVPSLSEWALALLSLMLSAFAAMRVLRSRIH